MSTRNHRQASELFVVSERAGMMELLALNFINSINLKVFLLRYIFRHSSGTGCQAAWVDKRAT